MRIEIEPGDELVVTLKDTDGEFRILYDVDGDNRLRVLADLPDDNHRGGHPEMAEQWCGEGPAPVLDPEIYCESFGVHDERDDEGNLIPEDVDAQVERKVVEFTQQEFIDTMDDPSA